MVAQLKILIVFALVVVVVFAAASTNAFLVIIAFSVVFCSPYRRVCALYLLSLLRCLGTHQSLGVTGITSLLSGRTWLYIILIVHGITAALVPGNSLSGSTHYGHDYLWHGDAHSLIFYNSTGKERLEFLLPSC